LEFRLYPARVDRRGGFLPDMMRTGSTRGLDSEKNETPIRGGYSDSADEFSARHYSRTVEAFDEF